MTLKIFDLYETGEVKVEDPGLKRYINIDSRLVLKSHGRNVEKFGKTKINIIERLANLIAVPGHRGKKHRRITSWASGKYTKNMKVILKVLQIIQDKTKSNPVQVIVKAVENSAPRDEVTVIEYGGARYPQAVDMSPSRRVSVALRNILHGAADKAINKKKELSTALADEIILASQGSNECFSVVKKNEAEKQADSAR
ncbi:MAG: 30S ribosomal protein S7 [Nanoarchaeota archaeon]